MTYYINVIDGVSSSDQWAQHLATIEKLDALNGETAALRETVERQGNRQHQAARHIIGSLSALDTSLQQGFDELGSEFRRIGDRLTQGLSLLADQQRVANLLSENIAQLLRVPDFQKERQYYIEQGFRHYQNARLDASLLEDALENLLQAESREKSDYVVLHRIGMIYLHAPDRLDLPRAEDYFRRAAKYAAIDSHPDAVRIVNLLAGDVTQPLTTQSALSGQGARQLAAGSLLQACLACLIQGKANDAAQLAEKAIAIDTDLIEAYLFRAKALVASRQDEQAAELLEGLLERHPACAATIASDTDLAARPAIENLLRTLRDKAVALLAQIIARLEQDGAAFLGQDAVFENKLENLREVVRKSQYLPALAGLESARQLHAGLSPRLGLFPRIADLRAEFAPLADRGGDFDADLAELARIAQSTGEPEFSSRIEAARRSAQAWLALERRIQALRARPGSQAEPIINELLQAISGSPQYARQEEIQSLLTRQYAWTDIDYWGHRHRHPGTLKAALTLESESSCKALAWSPAGSLASGHVDGCVRLWNISGRQGQRTLQGHSSEVTAIAFAPNGRPDDQLLASGGANGRVYLWDTHSGRKLQGFAEHEQAVSSLVFSPDGRWLASGSLDGTIRFWNTGEAAAPSSFWKYDTKKAQVTALSIPPEGKTLHVGQRSGECTSWSLSINDVASGDKLKSSNHHGGMTSYSFGQAAVQAIAFSPDGSAFAGCGKNRFKFFDRINGHYAGIESNDPAHGLAFTPDSTWLAVCLGNGVIDAWKMWDGFPSTASASDLGFAREQSKMRWQASGAEQIAFSPDGRYLASAGSQENRIRLWQPALTLESFIDLENSGENKVRADRKQQGDAVRQKTVVRLDKAHTLFQQARDEEARQGAKWLRRDFSLARQLYSEAAVLGSMEAYAALCRLNDAGA